MRWLISSGRTASRPSQPRSPSSAGRSSGPRSRSGCGAQRDFALSSRSDKKKEATAHVGGAVASQPRNLGLKREDATILCNSGVIVNLGVNAGRLVTLRCRAWSCPLCAPDRQKQLAALARAGAPTTFITLTSNPASGGSPASRARALADAWRVVAKRACKRYGYKTIPYLCVFEATKKGEPHLHILARVKWIDQKWLSAQMGALTGAPIVDIRQVKDKGRAASYIAKYIGKEPHRFETCKRYWRTVSWDLGKYELEPQPGDWSCIWEVRQQSLEWHRQVWEGLGWTITMQGRMMLGQLATAPP